MAISTVFKGVFFALLLVGVFSQSRDQAAPRPSEDRSPSGDSSTSADASRKELREAEAKLVEEQAANAVYDFATSLVDGIMDNMQSRTESRDGHNLTGSYGYSDGFFRRLIHYFANEDGFQILSEQVVPLGNGPRINPEGQAEVHTSIAGEEYQYNITKADIGVANQPMKLPGRA